jgi:uncharacterized protein (DUF885 family)
MNGQKIIIAACLLLLLAGRASAGDMDRKLAEFYQRHLDATFRLQPLAATRLGEHRFDHLLDDVSAAGRARWLELERRTLEELPRAVDYAQLSRPAQVDFEILRGQLQRSLWVAENIRPFERDPRVYGDFAADSVFALFAQSSLPKATNVANAVARMAQIPRVLAAARANLRDPPRVVVETAIKQNRGAINFFERELFELVGQSAVTPELRAAAVPVAAALRQHQRFLEDDLLPRATGEWRIGKEKFARKFELEIAAGITADEALAEAEAEFQRVSQDMYVLARQLWCVHFPALTLPPDDAAGRREVINRVMDAIARDHAEPQQLVGEAQATVAKLKQFIAEKKLLALPQPDRCRIAEMPEFMRGNSIAHLRPAPPLDPDTASLYDISPPPRDWPPERVASFVREYHRRMLHILTIHEAYPGHFVQFNYANRQPSLIRRTRGSDVYCEGWAVYSEQMMLDEGYGGGDLALRLTGLKFYLRAVANAILDHKMHCDDLTDEAALRFLTGDVFQTEGEALLKIIRAKQSSAQLSYYFVGRMALARLRQQIQREQGEKFDLGRYHQAVLEEGAVPVQFLPELVRARLSH